MKIERQSKLLTYKKQSQYKKITLITLLEH